MNERRSIDWREVAAAAAVFVPLLILRALKDAGPGPYGLDASQYVHLARHVMNGDGYVTTMSLYHWGQILPGRANVQPLWPYVLGYAGRMLGLIEAARLLPRLFYVIDLALLFVLVRRIAERFGSAARYAPHAAVLLLGCNVMFFSSTTHPYREGVSYCAGFLALLALSRTPTVARAFLAGVLAGVAFLGRAELVVIGVAAVLAMLVVRTRLSIVATYLAGAVVTSAPWVIYRGAVPFIGRLTWYLPPFVPIPRETTQVTSSHMRDWLEGALVMFQPGRADSYTRIFSVAALLVPLAAILWLIDRARRRDGSAAPDLLTLTTALTGVFTFVALFFYRSDYLHFLFGWRHGVVLIFLLAVALPYLLSHRQRVVRLVTIAAIAISVAIGAVNVIGFIGQPNLAYTPAERELLASLPPATPVLTTHAQMLGMLSDAYFHATTCQSSPATTRTYLAKLGVRAVIVYEEERGCRYIDGLQDVLAVRRSFGSGPQRIWLLVPRTTQASLPR